MDASTTIDSDIARTGKTQNIVKARTLVVY